ncbi:hypothetical protein [Bacillus thuringiensis]|uniref:hypothetical protein n=1 Tax=Bacillus thuringiensis TaxID=1428 RepID=UPI0020A2C0F7|nr:hypothetical protein [Bacillus thuringiensis]MDY7522166.1 hypothetical protein [Bacillus thuringiensis]
MIHFVMVKPKKELPINYLKNKNRSISEVPLVKNYYIYEEAERAAKIKIDTETKNSTALYFTEMMLETYNGIQHLFIKIEPQKIRANDFDYNLHELKIQIKNQLRRDWEECIWLEDEQSTSISEQLYGKIYRIENMLRQLINMIMIRKYGVKWWENYSPLYLQEKYFKRRNDYKIAAESFKNVNDSLLSIDTDDLLEIMTYKAKKLRIKDISKLEVMLEGVKEHGEAVKLVQNYKAIISEMKNNMDIKVDLWEEIFKEYFPESFIEEWRRFCKNRNHVAHNKLLDLSAFNKINENISNVEKYLDGAKKEVDKELSEEEETEVLEYVEEEEYKKELHELYIMEQEAGVSILDANMIFDKFEEVINLFIENIDDTYYFRNDIEIEKNKMSIEESEQDLLIISSKINDDILEVKSKLYIEEAQQGESEVLLKLVINEKVMEECSLKYRNGGAEFQKELGYYLPTSYNEFSQKGFDEFVEQINEFIEDYFPDLKDKMESEMYTTAKNGGNSPVADFPCEECGEEYVCTNDDIWEIGTCVNCGAKHEVSTCERCEVTYNRNIYGEEFLCENCMEHYLEE